MEERRMRNACKFWLENLKERDNLGNLDVDKRKILEWKVKVKVKVNLSLCFFNDHHAMEAYWGMEV
jgi:hypothetical protein